MIQQTRFDKYDKDDGLAGVLAPTGAGLFGNAGISVTASRAYAVRFRPSRPMTITLIAFAIVTAAGSDDACDVGLYDAAFNRIVSAGATTGKLNSLGAKTIAITSTPLQSGTTYYAAFSAGAIGTTAAALSMTGLNAGTALGDIFGAGNGVRIQTFQAAAHPLPATLTPGGQINNCPILAIRES